MMSTRIRLFPLTTAVLISLSQVTAAIAAPTWMPKFDPDKAVYVDPSMSNHPVAPYKFSSKLKAQLSKDSKEGLRYFVVAAQQGDEPLPSDKPLGVAKVDELLPTWANQPDFPKENYVVIFWVRKSDDLNKGSVGVNSGRVGREAGVMPDQLSDPNGLVIPALKANMPTDPERTMGDIVANIEGQVNSHRERLVLQKEADEAESKALAQRQEQDRVAAQQRQERFEKFEQDIQSWFQVILNSLPFVGGTGVVGFVVISRRRRKSSAQALVDEWSSLSKKASSLHLRIEEEELPKIKTLPLDSDPTLKARFDLFNSDLAKLMSWLSAANTQLGQAQGFMDSGDARKTINALTQMNVSIDNNPLGLGADEDSLEQVTAADLKGRLDDHLLSIDNTSSELLTIQQTYLELSEEKSFSALMERPGHLLDDHISEFNRYSLGQSSFLDASHGFDDFVKEYELLIQKSEVEFKSLRIVDSVETLHKATDKLDVLATRVQQALINKRRCEEVTEQCFSSEELEASITLASTALEQVRTQFRLERSLIVETRVQNAIDAKDNKLPQYKARFISSYQQKKFAYALDQLQSARTLKKDWLKKLGGIIDYPARLKEKKQMLENKLESITRDNQALKSRYQIDIENLAWNSLTLKSLDTKISEIESSVSSAKAQQRGDSSWSGGSDFGGSSGGGDCGSSGGGDCGSSGGGDY